METSLLFFRPFHRHVPILLHLRQTLGYRLIIDPPPTGEIKHSDLPGIDFLPEIINYAELKERVRLELKDTLPLMRAILTEKLTTLPLPKPLCAEGILKITERMPEVWQHNALYALIATEAVKKLAVKVVSVSPSSISRHRAVLHSTQKLGIPTVHLPHGVWYIPPAIHPDPAQVCIMPDMFAYLVASEGIVNSNKFVLAGAPFAPAPAKEFNAENERLEQKLCRQQLGIPLGAEVILYGNSWTTTNYIPNTIYSTSFVTSFKQCVQAVKERRDKGHPSFLVIRQHPSVAQDEDREFYNAQAALLGIHDPLILTGGSQTDLKAADVIVTTEQSSLALDAFAAARPVIAMRCHPRAAHYLGDTIANRHRPVASNAQDLTCLLEETLADPEVWKKLCSKALAFISQARPLTNSESLDRYTWLFRGLAEEGLSYLNRCPLKHQGPLAPEGIREPTE